MRFTIPAIVVAAGAALLCTSSLVLAQASHPLPPFHPSQHKAAPAPKNPTMGAHPPASHAPTHTAAVAKHAADSCDHLAHHFVGTRNHAEFMKECHGTHHAVLSHVPPHPAGAAAPAAAKGAAPKK